jgi:cytochrome c-type biogenesis protein CcmH
MTWLAFLLLAVAAMAPAAWRVRGRLTSRGRTESDLALHRAQLAELGRDLAEHRISASDHATATLEVQRRLLNSADAQEPEMRTSSRGPLLLAVVLVPLAAFGLYLTGGHPELPAQPLAPRMQRAEQRMKEEAALVVQLRQVIATVDPHSDKARQGYVLLGQVEESLGHFAEAAQAWRQALDVTFDPLLAAQCAEAESQAEGRVTEAAASLFRRALAAAPADAPWRQQVEARLSSVQTN